MALACTFPRQRFWLKNANFLTPVFNASIKGLAVGNQQCCFGSKKYNDVPIQYWKNDAMF